MVLPCSLKLSRIHSKSSRYHAASSHRILKSAAAFVAVFAFVSYIFMGIFGSKMEVDGKIQHTVFFKFPELGRGSDGEKAMDAVLVNFNSLEGIAASFFSHGTKELEKEAALKAVDWVDRTDGYTHCLMVVANDAAALKGFVSGALHMVRRARLDVPNSLGISTRTSTSRTGWPP